MLTRVCQSFAPSRSRPGLHLAPRDTWPSWSSILSSLVSGREPHSMEIRGLRKTAFQFEYVLCIQPNCGCLSLVAQYCFAAPISSGSCDFRTGDLKAMVTTVWKHLGGRGHMHGEETHLLCTQP